MEDIKFIISNNKEIAENTYEIILETEDSNHGITTPGQFVNIKLDGLYLRRPLSVADWTENELKLVYKVVGKGTALMSEMKKGKELMVLSPLGNGYDLSKCGTEPLLIGGGAGVPPIFGLGSTLIKLGKKPTAVLGFNSANEVFYEEEFKALGIHTIITTVDGSYGTKGFVTDVLESIEFTDFATCGPEAMLKALDSKLDKSILGQLSFEERMGCGFGACMGCSCKTKYGNKRICKEGPVLERGEIIW